MMVTLTKGQVYLIQEIWKKINTIIQKTQQ